MPERMRIYLKNESPYNGRIVQDLNRERAGRYLGNLLRWQGTRITNLSQALNQVFAGDGKSCGKLVFEGRPTLHASAGRRGGTSVTLFYYVENEVANLFAMGQHSGPATYELSDFRPDTGNFASNRISLG